MCYREIEIAMNSALTIEGESERERERVDAVKIRKKPLKNLFVFFSRSVKIPYNRFDLELYLTDGPPLTMKLTTIEDLKKKKEKEFAPLFL